MLATTQQERLTGVRALVTHLADAGLLAAGRDQETAVDACWALTGPRLFLDLTTDRGWQPDRYGLADPHAHREPPRARLRP